MELKKEKYINPFTDFGFKRLFGEDLSKDLLLDFLTVLLFEQQGKIIELSYLKNEKFGRTEEERRAIFDIYCENEKGEKFLVEMQKTKQAFFKDRSVYYATFPIQEQALRTEWNYKLNAVYTIGILDFVFDEDKHDTQKFRYDVQLTDIETKKVFYDKLTFTYLEMPKFNKTIDQLETHFDKWMFILKNLHKLDRLPENLKETIFERVFEIAEIAKLSVDEFRSYTDSLKVYRDMQNSLDTARFEAETKKTIEVIQNSLKIGLSLEIIAQITNFSIDEIIKIKQANS